MSDKHGKQARLPVRELLALATLAFMFSLLGFKSTQYLTPEYRQFLQQKAEQRSLRTRETPLPRANIVDRNGTPIAISSELYTLAIDGKIYQNTYENAYLLSQVTGREANNIITRVKKNLPSRYIVIERKLTPGYARQVKDFNIRGVSLKSRFERFYPAAEAASQLLGLTNSSGLGIDGLELAFNDQLQPENGIQRVLVSATGDVIETINTIKPPKYGSEIQLSIDMRLQNLAYQELKKQVDAVAAESGSILLVHVETGECLAVVNYPAVNPNYRKELAPELLRNRVFTDIIEPGSTIKPLTIAAVLNNGAWNVNKAVNIGKGTIKVDGYTIRDVGRKRGKLSVESIIVKSSNAGAALLGLALGGEKLSNAFVDYGLTTTTGSNFPGEVTGTLPLSGKISRSRNATMSYGYGFDLTLAQLSRAYLTIARDGELIPLRLTPGLPVTVEKVLQNDIARQVRKMMTGVTQTGGTAPNASIPGYRIAGKTGTVHHSINGKYSDDKYNSLFVGITPAQSPKLLATVIIRQPKGDNYYGSESAAPVFRELMEHSLRLLGISPEV